MWIDADRCEHRDGRVIAHHIGNYVTNDCGGGNNREIVAPLLIAASASGHKQRQRAYNENRSQFVVKTTPGKETVATVNLDRQVEDRLTQAEFRYTRGRREVVSALAASDGPLSAAELHDRLESLPLSSLYRSLSVLVEAGVIAPHFGKAGVTRYELAEWLRGHHHHLVCVFCGSIEDVDLTPGLERRLHQVVDRIGETSGFAASGHELEIEGRCGRCQ